ncbi:YggS family pyridoxal phosphate-dependent enzyme [Heyndrickxia ginsengihumi]|uniref:Pyridoxal phosphate homeostasis protein n=1 Tax=Heyndrickxia ginsengihumi TaxID=363870 RepID=A0A6M0P283_9BACI|nr:YggS family pyridoxal phosphate-dependent enzyme [Heyndrickxia ginsengihumi]MBE6183433.1 YggS family pyridoxal phosphate-dependent enzyme [Bacillus sp. (in: firmicutes)]MCM3022416.1 YggS family pyridoxal phosphate-dependent enzyme [Heyndrickxia ginsengihumi]NEY18641.1 YggS family pyridoxal phosphate-dependent enzyme [Heyndrickxia ginsengihumi]
MKVAENLAFIHEQIESACLRANRDPKEIKIIAVTKYVTTERAAEALDAGIIHLGENRDDGLLAKYEKLGNKPVWHFIGTLQSKKVKNIIDKVSYIHSLDRMSLAEEIEKRAEQRMKCFVQVNVSGEQSKHGMEPEKVKQFIEDLKTFSHIEIVGLMTMAPLTEDKEIIRRTFRELKRLQEEIEAMQLTYAPCHELSMGMSNDFTIAIEEGSTFVRIGTALVGS